MLSTNFADFVRISRKKRTILEPSFYAYHDPDWRSYNARLVAQYEPDDLDTLLVEAGRSHASLMAALERIPAEEFERDRGVRYRGWKVTIARLLDAEMHDERVHKGQVREFIIRE